MARTLYRAWSGGSSEHGRLTWVTLVVLEVSLVPMFLFPWVLVYSGGPVATLVGMVTNMVVTCHDDAVALSYLHI